MRNADGTLRVADHKCIMTLRTSAYADVSSWTKIWEAATIATGMCSTQGKKGLYSQIGESLFGESPRECGTRSNSLRRSE